MSVMTTVDYRRSHLSSSLFVSEPDKALKCTICQEIMMRPVQCRNGHLYCKGCIEKLLTNASAQKECPSCRVKMKVNELSLNVLAAGMIEGLTIYCPTTLETADNSKHFERKSKKRKTLHTENLAKSKCEWVGTVGNVNAHLRCCANARVHCPHRNCDATPIRSDLSLHLITCTQRPTVVSTFKNDCCQCNCHQNQRDTADTTKKSSQHNDVAEYNRIISMKNDKIASLECQLADLASKADLGFQYINKYSYLVDRCHCSHDVEAWKALNALAEAGDKVALAYTIPVLCADTSPGTEMRRNMQKANKIGKKLLPWLLKEDANKNVHASYILGIMHIRGVCNMKGTGLDLFLVAAQQGHIGAKLWVATVYVEHSPLEDTPDGRQIYSENIAAAVDLLKECIDAGLLEAKFDYANLLVEGAEGAEGFFQDKKQGVQYLMELADINYISAINNLGKCYENGTGLDSVNFSLAYSCYKKAADMGDPIAQCNVGVFHCLGNGVDISKECARVYFKKAVAQGFQPAKGLLKETFK